MQATENTILSSRLKQSRFEPLFVLDTQRRRLFSILMYRHTKKFEDNKIFYFFIMINKQQLYDNIALMGSYVILAME